MVQFYKSLQKYHTQRSVLYFKVIEYANLFWMMFKIAYLTLLNVPFLYSHGTFLHILGKYRRQTIQIQKCDLMRTLTVKQRPRKHKKCWKVPILRLAKSHVTYL